MEATVLVTGGSGFVGSHIVRQLLDAGRRVRTIVRSQAREGQVREMMRAAGAPDAALSFFRADLDGDDGWSEAAHGCDCVIHVASPIPAAAPRTEDERCGRSSRFSTARDAPRARRRSVCSAGSRDRPRRRSSQRPEA